MSAAEMVANFHFYFLGNPEGLAFDAPDRDYDAAIWRPLTAHLISHGSRVLTGPPAAQLEPGRHRLAGQHHHRRRVRGPLPGARRRSAGLTRPDRRGTPAGRIGAGPRRAGRRAGHRGAVRGGPLLAGRGRWRRTVRCSAGFPGNAPSTRSPSTTGWSAGADGGPSAPAAQCWNCTRTPATTTCRRPSWPSGCVLSWPCSGRRSPVCRCWSCGPGSSGRHRRSGPGRTASRPGVVTEADGLYLAGDGIRADFPSALMERAAATGILAANEILRREGAATEPIRSVRRHGLLARRSKP